MANEKVKITFEGDSKQLEASMKRIENALNGVSEKAKSTSSSAVQSFAKIAGSVMAVAGIYNKMYIATAELEKAQAKLNAVLKATGGAAGLSASQLDRMAKSLALATGKKTADVKNMQAILLTFTKINKDVFPETQAIVADMAAAFGGDLKSASIQLGKALQDPIKGVGALAEIGVSFNEQQKKQIEIFMKQGDLAKAQGVILAELKQEIGGVSQAMAQTPSGQLEGAFNKINDVLAQIGAKIMPVIAQVVTAIGSVIEWFGKLDQGIQVVIIGVVALAAALMGNPVIAVAAGIAALVMAMQTQTTTTAELTAATKAYDEAQMAVAQNEDLLRQLEGLKQGTAQYETTVRKLIAANPELKNSNISVASSFRDIKAAAEQANKGLNIDSFKKLTEQYEKGVNTVQEYARKIIELEAKQNDLAKNGSVLKSEELQKLQALKTSYAQMEQSTVKAGIAIGKTGVEVIHAVDTATRNGFGQITYLSNFASERIAALSRQLNSINSAADAIAGRASAAIPPMKKLGAASAAVFGGGGGTNSAANLQKDYDKMIETLQTKEQQMAAVRAQFAANEKVIRQSGNALRSQELIIQQSQEIQMLSEYLGTKEAMHVASLQKQLLAAGKHQQALKLMEAAAGKARAQMFQKTFETIKTNTNQFFSDMASTAGAFGKDWFEFTKALAMAQAVIDGIGAAVSSYKYGATLGGPPLGAIFAAASVAATGVKIAQIKAQQFNPPQAEFGGIIPGSVSGSLIQAGEKGKSEAIIPLEGEGADRLRSTISPQITIQNYFQGDIIGKEEIEEATASAVDKALYRLKLSGNSLALA